MWHPSCKFDLSFVSPPEIVACVVWLANQGGWWGWAEHVARLYACMYDGRAQVVLHIQCPAGPCRPTSPAPPQTTTNLSQRLVKNLGTYKDAVELLQHKDAILQVYGTDRLPETPISSSSGENHFEKGFRRALQAHPTREVEPSKPSPVAALGARVGPYPSPHKGAGSGQSATSSQSSSLATNTLKAKHKSRASGQETHRKARLDPVSLHRKAHSPAAVAAEGPHGHSSDGKHSRKCIM